MEMFIFFMIGLISGAFGVLVGAGGGFLFVPAVLVLLKLPPEMAAGSGLFVVFINSLSGSVHFMLKKRVNYSFSAPIIIGAIPGTFFGTWLLKLISPDVFQWFFACALLLLGVYLLLKNTSKHQEKGRKAALTLAFKKRVLLVFIGFVMGILSNFFGIGGGWLLVPMLIYLFQLSPHEAAATSLFTLSVYSMTGAISQIGLGHIHWEASIWGGAGVLFGSQAGAILSSKVSGRWIVQLLSVLLIGVSMKLFLSA